MTIQINQFFPKSYFSSAFSVERNFTLENKDTYDTLKTFIKKYSDEEGSWKSSTAIEIATFQNYDAPDFKRYLVVKIGDEDSSSTEKRSEESSLPASSSTSPSGTVSPKDPCLEKEKLKLPIAEMEVTSVNSKSSKVKSRIKTVFTFGLRKKNTVNGRTNERTRAILEKHNGIVSGL
jgi:hypothetical protein